jgi:predicted TIM-barrel enzyme
MIRMLQEWDVFTMCYVFTAPDALAMVEAGVDAVCVHVGPTMGGTAGQPVVEDTEQLLARAQEVMTAAKGARRDVLCLVHGGPFYDPETTRVVYERTDAVGFVAASAIERIPVEKAVATACADYKKLPMPKLQTRHP